MIEDVSLFGKLKGIIVPSDFKEDLYNKVAVMMFEQYEQMGTVVPAKIINYFESKEEQTEAASLFSTSFHEDMSMTEREKALNEIVQKIKRASLDYDSRHATDANQLMEVIKAQAELPKLHIYL